jgi:Ca2+:H+ antiporter
MAMLAKLFKPSLNWLLVFFPLAIAAEVSHLYHAQWATPTLIFIFSAIAIVPMAGWMGRATEHLAERLGEGVGGLLNATFGNAAELIIAIMFLRQAAREPEKADKMLDFIKASLTGSIIGNILLVLGAALLAGGIKYNVQRFNSTATRVGATLLMLAAIALLVPGLTNLVVHSAAPEAVQAIRDISLELSLMLLAIYGLSMWFTLKTHKHIYVGDPQPQPQQGPAEPHHEPWSVGKALGILLLATIGVGVVAEFMVGSVEEASKAFGLSELFVGVIVVAIVGNAAEHSTAVLVAINNRMDLSLTIAIGSSIQIALFVAPVLVLLSYAFGVPMDLVFTLPEIVAVGIAVIIAGQIAGDGESNWLEGVMLLMVYAMIGVMIFYWPGHAAAH